MQLNQLRYFLEVYRCENFTRAAKNLHISQPTITVAMRELEEELGISLFHRIKQRVYMTNAGRIFYNELERIMKDLDELTERMKDLGGQKNLVKIGIPPMMGTFLFPRIYKGFKEIYPQVELEVIEDGALEVQRLVQEEALDIAMMLEESCSTEFDIRFKPIMKSRFVFYTNMENELAKLNSISIRHISEAPLVLFNRGFYVNSMVHKAFREIGAMPNIVLLTGQINTIKRFVSENIASSIMLDECINDTDNIITVPIDDFSNVTIGMGWKRKRLLTKDVANFIKFVDSLSI